MIRSGLLLNSRLLRDHIPVGADQVFKSTNGGSMEPLKKLWDEVRSKPWIWGVVILIVVIGVLG